MVRTLTAALALLAGTPVAAQEHSKTRSRDWSFAVGVATDNRSKDTSKSGGDPYAYGQAVWRSADGLFYAGPSVETIDAGGADSEVALSGGVRPRLAGFDLDLDAAFKARPGADPGYDADAWEFTAAASRSIGRAKGRVQLQYSPDAAGSTRSFTWLEARLGLDLTASLTATAAIGRREQVDNVDYTGWNLGLTYAVTPNMGVDLRWYDTDADVQDDGGQYDGALVMALDFSF